VDVLRDRERAAQVNALTRLELKIPKPDPPERHRTANTAPPRRLGPGILRRDRVLAQARTKLLHPIATHPCPS
jgi:hypothetical protein